MNIVPRLVIAGTGGDSGKTLAALSLIAYWKSLGRKVAPFKKGPDFIDANWLSWASGVPARNLDTYMLGAVVTKESFFVNSIGKDIALIEGNRGLHDGFDPQGTHSTAELAKLLEAPVILVIDAHKVTRTAAAIVKGCQVIDDKVNLAGVILNRVAGSRHENILRESIESICGIPVIGAIPKLDKDIVLPVRHLGLITPEEYDAGGGLADRLAEIARKYLDMEKIESISTDVPKIDSEQRLKRKSPVRKPSVKICYFKDNAFTFYYPENLEALEDAGAEMIPVSSLESESLPEADGLYIGGGFPETHLDRLSFNDSLLKSVKSAAEDGLPIYAECGGFIYLCESLKYNDEEYALSGVFPLKLEMHRKPQGHGYCEIMIDRPNPFFTVGATLRGHEFHYSYVVSGADKVETISSVKRGKGCFDHRDCVVYKNTVGGYFHLNALSAPKWAVNFVKAAKKYKFS